MTSEEFCNRLLAEENLAAIHGHGAVVQNHIPRVSVRNVRLFLIIILTSFLATGQVATVQHESTVIHDSALLVGCVINGTRLCHAGIHNRQGCALLNGHSMTVSGVRQLVTGEV